MDEEPTESVDSDQPRYHLRNRPTAVSSSSSQVLIMSCANLPATDGRMAEGRSSGEPAEASLVDPPLREISQFSPILEVEQESQDTSSTEIYTPPLLQPDTVSPHSRVALDTQTHNAQPLDISPQQPLFQTITKVSISHLASSVLPPLLHTTILISYIGRLCRAIPHQCLCPAVASASDLLLSPLQKRLTAAPLLFGPCLLWPNGRPSQLYSADC